MKTNNKSEGRVPMTVKVHVIQGYYGYGWEDLAEYEANKYHEAKADLRAYDENERQYAHRLITRRVPNPDYKEQPEQTEAKKSEAAFTQPVIIYQSTDYDDTQDVQDYLSAIAESDVTISKTRNGDLVQVSVEGDDEAVTAFIDAYREGFDGIIKGAGKDGWVKPEDVAWYPKSEACKGEECDDEACKEEKLCKTFEVLTKSVLTCCDNLAKDQSLAGEFDDEVIYAEDAVKNAVESFKQMGEAVKVLKKALESHKNEDNMEVIGILSDAISKIVADDVASDVDTEEEGGETVIDQVEREYGNEPEGGEEPGEPEVEEEPTEF